MTKKNIKNDIYRMELEDEWSNAKDAGKIKLILRNSEDAIIEWHKDHWNGKREVSLVYEDWKEKLIECFSKRVSPEDFLLAKQGVGEEPEDFLKRINKDGKSLLLTDQIILGVFRNGLQRNRDYIRLALVGQTRITEEVFKIIHEANKIAQLGFERAKKRKEKAEMVNKGSKRIEGNVKKQINAIPQDDLLNKDNYIYLNNVKIPCLLDTGAQDNYITRRAIYRTGLPIILLNNPLERFTCLNEKFIITEKVTATFKYNEKLYTEEFFILPKRMDELIILGKKWIRGEKEDDIDSIDDIDTLIEKLCQKKNRKVKNYECKIDTIPGEIVVSKPTKIPQAMEDKVEEEVRRLLKLGYIVPSESTWLNKVSPVMKPNGTVRLTANLMCLNNLVILDKYSLPDMMEMIYKLNDKVYKTKIDLKDGFYQIPLHSNDRHKTAFRIKNRLYEWTRMPMGFKNSPAVFQRLMDTVLEEEIGKSCFVYVDDILVFGRTQKEHDEGLKRVLRKLIKGGLIANREKIELRKTEITFLGHRLSKNKIISELDNGQAIRDLKKLNNVEDVRRFLGTVNYYRKFIKNCAKKSEPLSRLLKKDSVFVWTKEQEDTFEKLKRELLSEKVLYQPDYNKEFYLETDASNNGLGAILSQITENEKMPIMFASRTLSETEKNYSISEKEMLAALWSMEKFEYFLKGREFILITDHIALKALNSKGEIKSARIIRWIERIQQFNFKVEYKPGEDIPHVDGLSRLAQSSREVSVNMIENTEKESKILSLHEELVHRGGKITTEEYNKRYKDKISEIECRKVLESCVECKLYNPIRVGRPRDIQAYEMGEKTAFDIIGPIEGKYIITAIDYFTRFGFAKVLKSRESKGLVKFLEEVYKVIPMKTLISDSAKENLSKEVEEWCRMKEIKRHFTTPHHHQSNGRVERFNRTLLEAINKQSNKRSLKHRVLKAVSVYNRVTHSKIGLSPEEARNSIHWDQLRTNIFRKTVKANTLKNSTSKVKIFKANDLVFIKNEIHKYKGQPKFDRIGTITEVLGYDTYRIRLENGRYLKRHSDQLRDGGEKPASDLAAACCETI
ncbi:MAG: RNase H-like domain-containing protein [Clostridium sp.]|uniref:RNase H-like domain-containing protein n=1 Tax=Clostridium sp. TaxID=1506 RepID=UPI003F2A6336